MASPSTDATSPKPPCGEVRLCSLAATGSHSGATSASSTVAFDPALNTNGARREWVNWATTNRCVPAFFHTPDTVEDIQAVLQFARTRRESVRVVGFGHSPGHIALTDGHMIAIGVHFKRVLNVDREAKRATVQSGISLEALNSALDEHGLALPTLGSISDQTLGGALACGTHGTSARSSSILAAAVVELELIDAAGVAWTCNAETNADLFNAARISLGALGVITTITLQCEAAYDLVETTVSVPFKDLITPTKFAAMLHHPGSDFVRFHWIPHTETVVFTRMKKVYGAKENRDADLKARAARESALVKYVQRARDWKDRFVGFHLLQALYYTSTIGGLERALVPRIARLYTRLVYPPLPGSAASPLSLAGASTAAASASPVAWVRQDRHDRILNFDCLFQQYVTEWAIDQRYTVEALIAVRAYIEQQRFVVHFPIEIRFGGAPTKGDGIWLSPCYATPQTWIGIIMYRPYGKDVAFQRYFEGFERLLSDVGARSASVSGGPEPVRFSGKPHWAKNVVMPLAEIPFAERYPRWNDFVALRERMDPTGMFANTYVRELEAATRPGKIATPAAVIALPSKL